MHLSVFYSTAPEIGLLKEKLQKKSRKAFNIEGYTNLQKYCNDYFQNYFAKPLRLCDFA
jgi:hypothetical protein